MGYLHRDLSLGNILIVDVEETPENMGMRVILNDYDSSKRSDVMTSAKSVRTVCFSLNIDHVDCHVHFIGYS